MDNNEFDSTLNKLIDQVSQFTTIDRKYKEGNNLLSKINFKSPILYYGVIPIGIFILLLLWKPNFITDEVSINGNIPERKLNFKKILIATVVLTSIICIIIFVNLSRFKCKESESISE